MISRSVVSTCFGLVLAAVCWLLIIPAVAWSGMELSVRPYAPLIPAAALLAIFVYGVVRRFIDLAGTGVDGSEGVELTSVERLALFGWWQALIRRRREDVHVAWAGRNVLIFLLGVVAGVIGAQAFSRLSQILLHVVVVPPATLQWNRYGIAVVFVLCVISPLIETLVTTVVLSLLTRWWVHRLSVSLLVAFAWGLEHAVVDSVVQCLPAVWIFFVLSLIYLKQRGDRAGVWRSSFAVALCHGLINLLGLLYVAT